MFGKKIPLFKLLGFQVNIDFSWFVIAILVTWSLAASQFPLFFPELGTATHWAMGVAGALGLFLSIVLHEFAHSIVARRYGVEMRGITLFIFGGVAEMTDEPPSPRAEFFIAVAGPIASCLIAGVCGLAYGLSAARGWPDPMLGVLGYLAFINSAVVVFNLVPAFPLDGGRILRSILWHVKKRLKWATRVTAQIGAGFGMALVVLGILSVLTGNLVGGMWWALIGLFLRAAANMSYQQLLIRRSLEGESVAQFMTRDPVSVPQSTSINHLVNDYVYKHHFKLYPIAENGRLLGCVNLEDIKNVPRDEWASTTVGQIAHECTQENTVAPDSDAMNALTTMNREGKSRLMVTDGQNLVGVLSLKDLMEFLSLKIELESD